MNGQRGGEQDSSIRVHLSFEERIAHMSTGYENSQSVVRFLDTKAVAVLGVLPVVLGVLGAMFKWQHDIVSLTRLRDVFGLSPTVLYFLFMLSLAISLLVLSWKTVQGAFSAILPRDTGGSKPSILFPYSTEDFTTRLGQFVDSPAQEDAIEDYERQLSRMAEIVAIKLKHVNLAIRNLMRLFLVAGIAVTTMVLIVAGLSLVLLVSGSTAQPVDDAASEVTHFDKKSEDIAI